MSKIPGQGRVSKAAVVVFEPTEPTPKVISFQFNPETLTRDVKASATETSARSDAFRLTGAPVETIKMDAIFDAGADGASSGAAGAGLGVYPQLAAFEMLITPPSARVIANTLALAAGTIEILPAKAPFTILVWGNRVLPVRVSGFAITEEAFDSRLNPVRAKIGLEFKVLTYSDLERSHPGYAMYLSHQIVKETLGRMAQGFSKATILTQKISSN